MNSREGGFEGEAVLAAIQYARVRLPRKPRLAPWLTLADLGDDRLQFRAAELAYTLRHPFLIEVFRTIEPRLDGRCTVDEIAAAGGPGVEPTTVIFLLKMLRANGLLQEAETPARIASEELVRWERQLRFLGHFVPDPLQIQSLLTEARVGVLGSEHLGTGIRAELQSLGTVSYTHLTLPTILRV